MPTENTRVVRANPAEAAAPLPEEQPSARKVARLVPREGKIFEKKIPLEFPIEFDGVLYEDVTIHRLHGKDFQELSSGSITGVEMASLMAKVPIEVAEVMDAEDLYNVVEACKAFFPRQMRELWEAEALNDSLSTHLSSHTS